MKTIIKIEIETKKFNKVYAEEDPSKYNKSNEITKEAEVDFHNLVFDTLNNYVVEGRLEEDVMEEHIVEGQESFSDVGSVSLRIKKLKE